MMEKVLFDPKCANALNKLMQTKISSHLFLVCNYNPDSFDVFSEDAKFLTGISNLYKFTIDASLINKIKGIDKKLGGVVYYKNRTQITALDEYLDLISCLRTFTSHNNHNNEIIDKTESWLIQTIHKNKFESLGDYSIALSELEKIGDSIYIVVSSIINRMVKEYSRSELCEAFQTSILLFYKTNDRLIREELRSAYKALSAMRGYVQDNSIAIWCEKMYIDTRKEKIEFLSKHFPLVKGDKKRQISDMIEKLQNEIDDIQANAAEKSSRCQGDITQLNSFDYLDYYCGSFGDKIKTYLPDVLKQNMTLLPQDIVQYIIAIDFKSVSTNDI